MDETLIKHVAELTGLGNDKVREILKKWVLENGRSPQNLSLDDLRPILVSMIQNVFAEVVDGENEYIKLSG